MLIPPSGSSALFTIACPYGAAATPLTIPQAFDQFSMREGQILAYLRREGLGRHVFLTHVDDKSSPDPFDPNALFLPDLGQPLIALRQGAVGIEISLQISIRGCENDAVLVPAGSRDLMAGVAEYLNGAGNQIPVVGVAFRRHPGMTHFTHWKALLAEAGFLKGKSVRPLSTPEEGIAFVDFLMAHLPEGWDLIDAFELLDFGPRREKKDINATLRSLGLYKHRWDGSKEEALTHPESNRGVELNEIVRRIESGVPIAEVLAKLPLVNVHRLQVETHVMDLYLSRPDWLERLRPGMRPDEREVHFGQYQGQNDLLRVSIRRFLDKI